MKIAVPCLAFVFIISMLAHPGAWCQSRKPVLVVLIYDQGCKAWCQKVRPMMKELEEQYGDKIEVVELDASLLKEAEAKSKALGVYCFLRDSAEWVPIVGIFSAKRKLLKELVGPKEKQVYASSIDKALSCN